MFPCITGDLPDIMQHDAALFDPGFENNQAPSIWCLSCRDGLIVAGCGNGRIEVRNFMLPDKDR